jgi:hypothetical protein
VYELFEKIRKESTMRIVAGVSLIIFGLLLHLVPLVPGSWAIVIGLEILGVRLLLQNKLYEWSKNSSTYQKFFVRKKKGGSKGDGVR